MIFRSGMSNDGKDGMGRLHHQILPCSTGVPGPSPALQRKSPLTPTCRGKSFQKRRPGPAVELHHAMCLSHSSNVACGLSSLNGFGDNRQ